MIRYTNRPHLLKENKIIPGVGERNKTIAGRVMAGHTENGLIKFDTLASHDITYVGIIQTARASGLKSFPVPYVLTNCHNSLCAVGGTINEDDHAFGLSAAQKYGGEFVPAHMAVIHQYVRERYAAPGRMILGSDSHTRYGPYGTMGIGEGGPELVKQLLKRGYADPNPDIVAVWLEGEVSPGVGPMDIALALIGYVYKDGLVKNKVLEFTGPGVEGLSMDFRNGIDVMTTETTCLSSVWRTDKTVKEHLNVLGRGESFEILEPLENAGYDALLELDLGKIKPMIAIPFHPGNAMTVADFKANVGDILDNIVKEAVSQWDLTVEPELCTLLEDGKLRVTQGVVAGCAGGLAQNIRAVKSILEKGNIGNGPFNFSVYPASQPMALALTEDGTFSSLMASGASIRSAFCGPCFGAGDVPSCGGFSIRHTTRNFPNREGSKPADKQTAYTALMDARSIAATALNGGILTGADEIDFSEPLAADTFNDAPYSRVYNGFGKEKPETELKFGPNITDWPVFEPLPEDITMTVAAAIYDPVTTTDELIPSGDTSSYRSNPIRLSQFTLSRKDPQYVARCEEIGFGSVICALRPGDGSAREQAASCQRVLGGIANIALEYATKRYRSNLINWGMLPFIWKEMEAANPEPGDKIELKGLRSALLRGESEFAAIWNKKPITLHLPGLTEDERDIILAGCLINYYRV